MERNAAIAGLTLATTTLQGRFRELIEKVAADAGPVVLLIDEYDKPLVDFLNDPDRLEANRSVMKSFYSVLKGRDEHIRLLFVTGVSRFSRVSIFSDLNNLEDITIDRNFHALVGITQAELETVFAAEIESLSGEYTDILRQIKEWYNGYSWGNVGQRLYNPFSLLNLMKGRTFMNYWFTTGTPTFLLEQLKKRKLSDMDSVEISLNALADFNTDRLNMASLLFQTGCLTIKALEGQLCTLGYPNREVRQSLLDGLLDIYRESDVTDSLSLVTSLRKSLASGDVGRAVAVLNSLIGDIPYDYWNADKESIFTIITVLSFKLAGVDAYTEVHSSKGRCDVLVRTDDYIYVIEIKLDGTAQEALAQVLRQDYLQPYGGDKRKKLAIGISFSSAARKVAEYLVQEVG